MDAEASEAAMEAATRKRAASAPPEPVSGSGGPTHVASSVLVAAYQPAQKAFNAEVQQQARQYASALSKQHAHAAKLGNLRSMKEAGQLPKNLQFQMPRIYGEGMEEVDVDYAGDKLGIGFNAKYLLDALAALAHDEVALELSGELDPGVIRPVGEGPADFVGVIMPMRI